MAAAPLAVVVAVVTLALVVTRPRGLNEGVAALAGGAAVLLLRLVPLHEAVHVEANSWNIFLFFLGMMAIAALADVSGVFDVVTIWITQRSQGRVAVLYLAVFLLGTVIALLFANDTAALVLTPIVYALVVRLSLDPLPFVFATTFIADTASIGLPVSNPLNVIVGDSFHLDLRSYVAHLWLPALLAVIVNIVAFFIIFRHDIGGRFRGQPIPQTHIGLPSTFAILGALAAAYLLASALVFPLGIVALSGAIVLALNLVRLRAFDPLALARDIGWPIFGFIGGMLLVVQGLQDTGVTDAVGSLLVRTASHPGLSSIAAVTAGTAVGSNLVNNLPMALVMTATLHPLHITAAAQSQAVYATILGCDLGPNLTHLGSLATFIWLFFLRRKGVDVSTWDYFRIGIVVTPFMLAAAMVGLWVTTM